MTDRELLERAAKAAGIPIAWGGPNGDMARRTDTWDNWSPLDDSGQNLCLAVQLGIEIHPDREVREVYTAFSVRRPNLIGLNTMEPFGDDEMAATRRAVVRAAAAMADQPTEQAA